MAETLLPATVVDDPHFTSRWAQMEATPYYILRREQFWDRRRPRGYRIDHAGLDSKTYLEKLHFTVSTTDGSSSQQILGLEFGVEAGYARKKSPISADLSAQLRAQLEVIEYDESSLQVDKTEEITKELPIGPRFLIFGWSLVDRFTLLRYDRKQVASWDAPRASKDVLETSYHEA